MLTRKEFLASTLLTGRDLELAARAYDTLTANVYPDSGYPWSPYRCTSPGKENFQGVWNWDSAFHVLGFARWDGKLAWENVLGFFQFQRPDGLLPDVIFEDGNVVDTFTKPPVFAWAIETLQRKHPDMDCLGQIYPRLVKNEEFWITQRCDRGLFYFDADYPEREDYLQRVKYESGLDNSIRWDRGITEYWAIDLNCYMVMTYRSLAYLAAQLGLEADRKLWLDKENALTARILEELWDENQGIFNDKHRFTREISGALSPAIFMPLFVEIASRSQAEKLAVVAREHFHGKMPTIAFDDPAFSTDYWRGPTWLNVAYFAAKSLKNYAFPIADEIRENILAMCDAEKAGICENYNSLTGEGLCCKHFSWSSVFILEFLLNW